MATKPAKSVGSSKRPDKNKKAPAFTSQDGRDQRKKQNGKDSNLVQEIAPMLRLRALSQVNQKKTVV